MISIRVEILGKIIKMDSSQGIEGLDLTKKMREEGEVEGEVEEEDGVGMMGMEGEGEEMMEMEEEGEEVEILKTIENHGMIIKIMKDFLKDKDKNRPLKTMSIMLLMIIDVYLINDQSNSQIFLLIDDIFLCRLEFL